MKPLFICLLLSVSFFSFSQKPPKGTILIVAKNELSRGANFAHIKDILLLNNFSIAISDTNLFYVESNRKRIPNYDISYSLHFLVKDSTIAIFGKMTDAYMPNTLSKQIFMYIENKGVGTIPFYTMLSLAKQLKGNLFYFTDIDKMNEAEISKDDDMEQDDIYYKSHKRPVPVNKDLIPI
jgi:hypothetical protein